jgi:large subunit ribosomal protein L24
VSISRIKKDDEVMVIAGTAAGKTGKVLRVDREKGRAYVAGVNVRRCTIKRSPKNPQGGLVDREAPVALSNLMPYDPAVKKGVRVSRVSEGERRVRKSKSGSHIFD